LSLFKGSIKKIK